MAKSFTTQDSYEPGMASSNIGPASFRFCDDTGFGARIARSFLQTRLRVLYRGELLRPVLDHRGADEVTG